MPRAFTRCGIERNDGLHGVPVPRRHPDRFIAHDRRPGYERTDLAVWHSSVTQPGVIHVRHESGRPDFFANGQNTYLRRVQRM